MQITTPFSHPFMVVVRFKNGSLTSMPFRLYSDAHRYCQNNIAYTGGEVSRVEIVIRESTRAIWDATWDEPSQQAGLRMPS